MTETIQCTFQRAEHEVVTDGNIHANFNMSYPGTSEIYHDKIEKIWDS